MAFLKSLQIIWIFLHYLKMCPKNLLCSHLLFHHQKHLFVSLLVQTRAPSIKNQEMLSSCERGCLMWSFSSNISDISETVKLHSMSFFFWCAHISYSSSDLKQKRDSLHLSFVCCWYSIWLYPLSSLPTVVLFLIQTCHCVFHSFKIYQKWTIL